VESSSLDAAVQLLELAIGASTLLYLIFGLGARAAVTEFKVDQLWKWYIRDRKIPHGADDAANDPR